MNRSPNLCGASPSNLFNLHSGRSDSIASIYQVKALVASGVAGAAISAVSRNWKQVAVMTSFLSMFCAIADQSRPIRVPN